MIALAIALLAADPTITARGNPPAKMVVFRGREGIAITDYPTLARCEAARAIVSEMVRRLDQRGDDATSEPIAIGTLCIPG